MISAYLKIALRNLRSHKGYTFITVAGLVVGFICCLLIALWVWDELSYDRFHPDADRIYRVIAERGKSDDVHISANTSYPIIPHLRADFREIETATRARRAFRPIVSHGEVRFREERFYAADSTFFDVFPYPFIAGDRSSALGRPGSVVLTRSTARRFFGNADPLGSILTYKTGAQPVELTVTGIVADPPHNTHLHFDFVADIEAIGGPFERWQVFVQNYSYVKLAPRSDPHTLGKKLDDFIDRYVRPELEAGEIFKLYLQPLTDIHLRSQYTSEAEPNGNVAYVYLFSAVGLFILAIASVNFVNLMTARAGRRAREVGLRKTLGATRRQLVAQFLAESSLLCLAAMLLAIVIAGLLLPAFESATGKPRSVQWLVSGPLLAMSAVVALVVGTGAGAYPALFLSSFRPASTLKGPPGGGRRGARTRQSLVVFQFAVSIALIASSLTVYRQMEYVRSKELGFEKEHVVVVPIDQPTGLIAGRITEALERHSGIVRASASMLVPATEPWTYNIRRASSQETIGTGFYKIDHNFLETYGLDLVAGRNFDRELASDSSSAFILNEEAVRRLGYDSASDILDEPLVFGGGSRPGRVVGVVGDFHATSLHQRIEPLVFFVEPEYYYLSARLAPGAIQPALEHMAAEVRRSAPHLPFDYFFVDEHFNALHRSDARVGLIFGVFSAIAILLAALGLIGLAAYSAEQRRKEIGVRKTLGASIPNIVGLLSSDFLKPVGIAFLIGSPIAYLAMGGWLERFAYRVEVGWWIFVAVGTSAVVIALLSVGYQSLRAALADPVKSLRSD